MVLETLGEMNFDSKAWAKSGKSTNFLAASLMNKRPPAKLEFPLNTCTTRTVCLSSWHDVQLLY